MTSDSVNSTSSMTKDFDALASSSRWLITMGIATFVLGVLALVASVATTLVSILFIGSLFIVSSILQAIFAVTSGRWAGFGLHLLLAVLYAITGAFLVMNPAMGAATLTLFLAFFFMTSGLFRIVASLALRFAGWGWALFSGLVATSFGVYIVMNLPEASLILLGVLFAIDLIFYGANLTTFGIILKRGEHGRPSSLKTAFS